MHLRDAEEPVAVTSSEAIGPVTIAVGALPDCPEDAGIVEMHLRNAEEPVAVT